MDALGEVNIALVPVGDGGGLSAAKAAEAIGVLDPNIVVPMHYATPDSKLSFDPLDKFIKQMGLGIIESETSLKITKGSLPEDTRVMVLEYQK